LGELCLDPKLVVAIVEAGVVPACVRSIRRGEPHIGTFHALDMLFKIGRKCNGLHPLLSGGVLLPHVLPLLHSPLSQVAQDNMGSLTLSMTAHVVFFFSTPRQPVQFRPHIPSPATERIAAGYNNKADVQQHPPSFSPMSHVASDSLFLISSFLCGCDFLRVIRVCRRWARLRLTPAAWPPSRPCAAHEPAVVDAFFGLLDQPESYNAACIGLSSLRSGGSSLRLLLQRGVLRRLLPRLSSDTPAATQRLTMVLLCRFDFSDEHVPVLTTSGAIPKLVALLSSPSVSSILRINVCEVLHTLFHDVPALIDVAAAAVQAKGQRVEPEGCLHHLLRLAAASALPGTPEEADLRVARKSVVVLATVAHKGSEGHRRMLLSAGFLPRLLGFIVHAGTEIAARPPLQRGGGPVESFLNRLKALEVLLQTKRAMEAEAAITAAASDTIPPPGGMIPPAAVKDGLSNAAMRAQLEPLLDHWHVGIRQHVAQIIQRELAD